MTNNEKHDLYMAIGVWQAAAPGEPSYQAWDKLVDAVNALGNQVDAAARAFNEEAYSRAYEHWREINCKRHDEIEQLKQELAETKEDLGQMKQYLEEAQEALGWKPATRRQTELDEADEEIERLKTEVARPDAPPPANSYYADACAEHDRLRTALETLADRYHAQMCYQNRRYPHSRRGCPYVLAVVEANVALGPSGITIGPDVGLTYASADQVVDACEPALGSIEGQITHQECGCPIGQACQWIRRAPNEPTIGPDGKYTPRDYEPSSGVSD